MKYIWLALLLFPFYFIFAQTLDPSAVVDRRAQLENELQNLEKEIEGYRGQIQSKQKEAQSLERDISLIDSQIKKSQLEIRARNISISKLQTAIGEKNQTISVLEEKIEKEKASLGELIRNLYELDQTTLVEVLFSYDNLSDFFVQSDTFDTIQESLQRSFDEIRTNKTKTETERDDLEDRKAQEVQLKTLQEIEKKRVQEREAEKKKILADTRGQEKNYKKIMDARSKNAAAIRSELFVLNGSGAIPFEKALDYAQKVERGTGVRAAFLLGIIAEESNLGANVGTGNWKTDLSHARCAKQRDTFQDITSRLGLNPDKMPVSKRAWYGYCGGAMGPAQFIPTTWILYEDAVSAITGHNPPNPWDPYDAFTASGLLLRDNGAAAGTYSAEHTAALKYLAGGNWKNPAYRFYGDDVMALAQKYQDQINILSSVAKR
ncbi:lytic murein transglycosylase [Candidatus Giovannonibacteria bacterium]|nr:lytic murein transglycosylase [Candidatus Giovannonibacteria bacterium]